MQKVIDDIKEEKLASENNLSEKRDKWAKAEDLFFGNITDAVSSKTRSKVFDPKMSTLAIERSYRVMANLPMGKVRGTGKDDMGDAILKNLLLEKYVIPNANSQFDFLTKMRLVNMYSQIYGNFYSLIDWNIGRNGYIGPDLWLLNIRDVFPQVGAISLNDSDSVIIRTWRPLSYFENLKKTDGYKNVPKIITELKKKSDSKSSRNDDDKSRRESNEYTQSQTMRGKGYFEILTRFERDRWVDLAVDADIEFRDQKNPHDDEDLPVKCKYALPLLDDPMGLSDFDRGGSMQRALNSNWNLYFDGVGKSIDPPILINKDNIASFSSIKNERGARWLVRNQINNAVQPLNLSPKGTSEFNNVHGTVSAAILNLFGTTETNVTEDTDPGFGKTPQALKMQNRRQNTRDNADLFYTEQFLTDVMKKFTSLLSKKQGPAVTLRMFPEEIDTISKTYPEIADNYNEEKGELSVPKSKKNMLYDYEIVKGSTYELDEAQEQKNLAMLLSMYQQYETPQGNLLESKLKAEGYNFKFGELFKRTVSKSGIQDWDKILEEMSEEEKDEAIAEQNMQQFAQAAQEVMGEMQGQGQAQGNINQVPPMPEQEQQGF